MRSLWPWPLTSLNQHLTRSSWGLSESLNKIEVIPSRHSWDLALMYSHTDWQTTWRCNDKYKTLQTKIIQISQFSFNIDHTNGDVNLERRPARVSGDVGQHVISEAEWIRYLLPLNAAPPLIRTLWRLLCCCEHICCILIFDRLTRGKGLYPLVQTILGVRVWKQLMSRPLQRRLWPFKSLPLWVHLHNVCATLNNRSPI